MLAAKIQAEEPKLGMQIRGTLLLLVSTFKNLGHTDREGAAEPQAYKMLHFLNSRWPQAPFHLALTGTKVKSSFFKNIPVFLKIVFLIYLFFKSVLIIQFNLEVLFGFLCPLPSPLIGKLGIMCLSLHCFNTCVPHILCFLEQYITIVQSTFLNKNGMIIK